MKQNPFSLYDFLGYLVPGAFLIMMLPMVSHWNYLYSEYVCHNSNSSFIESCSFFLKSFSDLIESIPDLDYMKITFLIIFSYAIGHIISYISSITVERFSLWKYGYPSKYLLGIDKDIRFRQHFKTFGGFIFGFLNIFLLTPCFIIDTIGGIFFGLYHLYYKPVDKLLISVIKFKVTTLFVKLGITKDNGFEDGCAIDNDYFRIVYHYTFENSKNHQHKLNNYVALYGFLRTMCLNVIFIFWYFFFNICVTGHINWFNISVLIFISMISYVFFMGFMKFYRRFTLEGLMILASDINI